MRFLIDENVRQEVREFLEKAGHKITKVPSGIENGKIVQLAKKERYVLLTHDRHFANISLYPPEEFAGIIRIKIHPPSASSIIQALKDLLLKLSPEKINGKLVVLEKDGFRIR